MERRRNTIAVQPRRRGVTVISPGRRRLPPADELPVDPPRRPDLDGPAASGAVAETDVNLE